MSKDSEEKVQIYNCFNEPTKIATKKDVHSKGLWHRAVAFIIIDTKSNEIIFQHNESPEELSQNEFFVKLNGGHIQYGEEPIDGFRELEEELGLKYKADTSLFIGTYQLSVQFSDNFINNEFIYFYIVP
ncbi:NUDIX domain-containing protein, partial [Candidatus Dojkabacteria bacterium]|nr:NUDIX domain-containing protein [Candidatus Dojkabacteria bacterium]